MKINLEEFHKQLLDILIEFDRICRENGIKYSLAYGTLLGAVRHKGFIPWDDDVDVMMDRENFNKFCKIQDKVIKEEYFFQSKQTEKKYPYNICRLRKNNTAMIYDNWKDSGINLGIYIDIFPVDHKPDSKLLRFIQSSMIIILTPVRIARNKVIYMNCGKERLGKILNSIKNIIYFIAKLFPQNLCDKIENHFITKYNNKECKKIGIICEGGTLLRPTRDNIPFDSKYMKSYREVDFEGHKFMAVNDCDGLLKHWYGDYMVLPPEDQRVLYHQPSIIDIQKSYKEYI